MQEYADILINEYQERNKDIEVGFFEFIHNDAAAYFDLIGFDQFGVQWSQRHYYDHKPESYIIDEVCIYSSIDDDKWELDE
jgi:hypothetical protein